MIKSQAYVSFYNRQIIFCKNLDNFITFIYNNRVCAKYIFYTSQALRLGEFKTEDTHIMFEQLKALLVDELQIDPDDITMEAELSADLGINSIELADLVMLCEERFEITIDDSDIGRFVTIRDVVDYLETLQK